MYKKAGIAQNLGMEKHLYNQTIFFKNCPKIIGNFSVVGPKEGQGNFGDFFDIVLEDDRFGEETYEKAERKMIEKAFLGAIDKAKLKKHDISIFLAGDLLNQIISSSYAARSFDTPYAGVFGACSTMAESLAIGAALVDGEYFKNVACATGSHFSTAERQFRFPLELGNQRPPTSQWTCTASACSILSLSGRGPCITSATFGKVTDYGVRDVNNFGGIMAPAAANTLLAALYDTKTTPEDFDLIITGDLGKLGSEVLLDLMERRGVKLGQNYCDCGQMMFSLSQQPLMGGSGCGCCASFLNSVLVNQMKKGVFQKVLFVATGALLSTTSSQQGDTLPAIAHAVVIENNFKK